MPQLNFTILKVFFENLARGHTSFSWRPPHIKCSHLNDIDWHILSLNLKQARPVSLRTAHLGDLSFAAGIVYFYSVV